MDLKGETPLNKNIIVNLSRIGKNGTGLFLFAKQVVKSLKAGFDNINVITSESFDIDDELPRLTVPDWVTITQAVSKIRPIMWILYATFFFPEKRGRILSTTHHILPGAKKQIISILDLRPYFYADSLLQRVYFRVLLPRFAKNVAGIITISEESKRLIVDKYKVEKDRVFVVPLYVDVSKFTPALKQESKQAPYLLMVGATWKHKNAHEVIQRSNIWAHKYRLKILAGPGAYRKDLVALVRKCNLEDNVDFMEYQSETDLISLYRNAAALVYPSLMEGFGVPPIEAMACGTPVIVSETRIFREIYNDVPIYVNLGDSPSWLRAFQLLDDEDLMKRKMQQGFNKVREYNEERMAAALIKAVTTVWPDIETKKLNNGLIIR